MHLQVKTHTLSNGLKIVLVDTKAFPSISTMLFVGAGSRYETAKNNGISHFLEHVFFKGSKKYPTAISILTELDSLGGVSNAFTSKNYTGYFAKTPTQHFGKVIDILADIIQHPLLPSEEIEKEKGTIIEEINMYLDTPSRDVLDVFEEVIYRGSSLGFKTIGTKRNVASFTRKTFKNYVDSLYFPNNAVLIIAGGLNSKQDYISLINTHFGTWKRGTIKGFKKISKRQSKPEIYVKNKKTEQYHFCLGYRAFSLFDARRYALSVLSAILGLGMSSRLFIEAREKRGLCYYIHTYSDLYTDTGSFFTHAGVRADVSQLNEAIRVIIGEHEKLKKGIIKNKELRKAKEMIKGRLLLSFEDTTNLTQFIGKRIIIENKLVKPQELIEKIEKVSIGEIIKTANEVFKLNNLNVVVIGAVDESKIVIK